MELVRSATGPAARLGADGLDGVDGGEHHLRIVHVRGAHQDRERDAVGVDHKMALRALFAAIRWVLARFLAPPGPAPRRSPARPGPSRCDRPGPALREAPGAACARRPLGTSLAACASTSSRSHTPSRQASTPRGCPSSARTGSPSAPPGPTPGAVRPWASAAPAGAAARSAPTTHQATVPSPWHPPPWLLFCFLSCLRDGFVRRTYCVFRRDRGPLTALPPQRDQTAQRAIPSHS